MQTLKFITVEKEKATCWCTTNTLKGFRDFMQYILDNCRKPEIYQILDTESNLVYNAYDVATKQYSMRKRSFEERMNGTYMGKWDNIHV